jgi:serine/threonine-protein kinase
VLASPPQQSHLQPGFRLDRYELLYPLAQGGMATVWVARLTGKHGFEKLVAVKTILPQYADDGEFRTMFLDEARIAARIRHLNVAEILDLGEEGSTLFLVMEWVDGDSLARLYNAVLRENQRIPYDVLARIASDACAGLHAAHELRDDTGQLLGVVHRDVSPQNILVASNGVTKIIDFGVAKAAQRASQETSAGLMKGKIQYASPEQAMGKVLDRRCDVWAMGTVLYQMISGRLPYEGDNQLAMLHALTSGKPPRPLPPTVPRGLSDVVRRALAPRLDERFASCDEMRAALDVAVQPVATAGTVAGVVSRYLSDRAAERRKDVQDALAQVSSRGRLPSISNEGSGRVNVMTPAPAMPLPPLTTPSRSGVQRNGTLMMVPGGATPPPIVTPPPVLTPPPMALPPLPTPAPVLGSSGISALPGTAPGVPSSVSQPVALPAHPPPSGLRGGHYAAAGLATVIALGVWGTVGVVAMRPAANAAPPASATSAPATATTSAAPETPPATIAAEPPPPPPPASTAPAAPPAPSAAPPADPVAAARPPGGTAPPAAAPPRPATPPAGAVPPKKKKKVDDGF